MGTNARTTRTAKRRQKIERQVTALVVVRDDGTSTVVWGQGWNAFYSLPGTYANEREAKRAVERVVGRPVTWTQTEPTVWEGEV